MPKSSNQAPQGNGAQAPKITDDDVIAEILASDESGSDLWSIFPNAANTFAVGHNVLAYAPRKGLIRVGDTVTREIAALVNTALTRATLNNKKCTSISEVYTATDPDPTDVSFLEDCVDQLVMELLKAKGLSIHDRAWRRPQVDRILALDGSYAEPEKRHALVSGVVRHGKSMLAETKEPRQRNAGATSSVASAEADLF